MKSFLLYAIVGLGVVAYNVATQADRDATGNIVDGGSLDAFTVRLGDCFNDEGVFGDEGAGEVASLPGVPCSEPHDNEVYAVFDVTFEAFPGDDQMADAAFEQCLDRFAGFVGVDYELSNLDITALYPSSQSWSMQNDREVICAVFEMNGEKLMGSAKDSAI
jgi:hypothetical protein